MTLSFSISQLGNSVSGVLYYRLGLRNRLSPFAFLSSKKIYGFLATLSYRRLYFDLLDEILKVVCGNSACFAEYQMTFRLALPSLFRGLSNIVLTTSGGWIICICIFI